ncbi:MAG TPA: type II toxin-antitoxin system VapC family toxin [Stellaceae bacterium]|jgi:hypothetical protein|nr:type II toxin-antitoxin system VapC family toxin [Stellaceae bacterium]
MIIVDTNVVSELMKPHPDAAVIAWAARQSRDDLATTSITKAEVLYGIARLPDGRRRSALADAADRMFGVDFGGRVLSFDGPAAISYATIVSARERSGHSIKTLDALIAAIAATAGAAIATRNVRDFEGSGIRVVNPWTAS